MSLYVVSSSKWKKKLKLCKKNQIPKTSSQRMEKNCLFRLMSFIGIYNVLCGAILKMCPKKTAESSFRGAKPVWSTIASGKIGINLSLKLYFCESLI